MGVRALLGVFVLLCAGQVYFSMLPRVVVFALVAIGVSVAFDPSAHYVADKINVHLVCHT